MEKLHDDVLSNIFIRLNAKLLARMRCVSKPWNALLCEPSFVKSHLNRSIQNNNNLGIYLFLEKEFLDYKSNKQFRAVPYRYPCDHQIKVVSPSVFAPSISAYFVYGSVNGLICFVRQSDPSHPTHVIYIWNPSLSAILRLPPYTIPAISSCSTPWTDVTRLCIHCRFGFDPKTDDYKVVKITFLYELPNIPSPFFVKEWLQVEVYSMRKGSWKTIPQRFPSHVMQIYNEDQVCADGHDGHLHWLGYLNADMKQQTIVAFDLHVETFSEIALPDAIIKANTQRHNSLGVLDGKLCLMSQGGEKFEVWVMNDYGVTESWVKHQLYSQFSNNLASYGLVQYNEFLSDSRYKHLALHVNKVKICKIMGISFNDKAKFIQYVDSLVWVAPSKGGSTHSESVDFSFMKEPRGKILVHLLLFLLLCMILCFIISRFM